MKHADHVLPSHVEHMSNVRLNSQQANWPATEPRKHVGHLPSLLLSRPLPTISLLLLQFPLMLIKYFSLYVVHVSTFISVRHFASHAKLAFLPL